MKKNITLPSANVVLKLQQNTYSIAGHAGLNLLVRKSGSKVWRYVYRDKTSKKIRTLTLGHFPSIDSVDAVSLWAIAKKDVQVGKDPQGDIQKEKMRNINAPTVNDVFDHWMEKRINLKRVHPKQVTEVMNKNVLPFIGEMKIEAVESEDIDAIIERIRLRKTKRVPVVVYNLMQQMFRYAKQRKLLIKENIFNDYQRPDDDNQKVDVKTLSDDDIKVLWYEFDRFTIRDLNHPISKFTPYALRIMLLTGLHPCEVNNAKWSDIDFDDCMWHIPSNNRKVRNEYYICISDLCLIQLYELKKLYGDYERILGDGYANGSGFRKVTDRILPRLKKNRWTPKDTRSTFATLCAKTKVIHEIRQKCLGHSNGSIENRHYQKYDFIEERREAFQLVANYIAIVVGIDNTPAYDSQDLLSFDEIEDFLDKYSFDLKYHRMKLILREVRKQYEPRPTRLSEPSQPRLN